MLQAVLLSYCRPPSQNSNVSDSSNVTAKEIHRYTLNFAVYINNTNGTDVLRTASDKNILEFEIGSSASKAKIKDFENCIQDYTLETDFPPQTSSFQANFASAEKKDGINIYHYRNMFSVDRDAMLERANSLALVCSPRSFDTNIAKN